MTRLRFRIETQKIKSPRVVVLRVKDDKNQQGNIIHKTLGSFSARRSYDDIIKQLTSEELYEFENFVKVLDFSKNYFDCEADELDRFIIKVAPAFKQALLTLWQTAKNYDIEFIPEYEMLLALLSKAKELEQKLALFTKDQFKALSLQAIDITSFSPPKGDSKEDKKLLRAVIEQTKSLEALAALSNTIAVKKYQKSPKFRPHYFDVFNHQNSTGKKPILPKWYYTVALDILEQLQIDPVISLPRLTKHWLRLNKKQTLALTIKAFNQQFSKLKDHPTCIECIQAAFALDELLKVRPPGQKITSTTPSVIIEHWVKYAQKKKPNRTTEMLIAEFNQAFPNLADHPFLIQLIKQGKSHKPEEI